MNKSSPTIIQNITILSNNKRKVRKPDNVILIIANFKGIPFFNDFLSTGLLSLHPNLIPRLVARISKI